LTSFSPTHFQNPFNFTEYQGSYRRTQISLIEDQLIIQCDIISFSQLNQTQ